MSAFSFLKPVGGYFHVCICIREILYSEIICLSETANSYNRYESAVRNVLATSCPTKIYLPKNWHFSYLPKKTYVGSTQISSILTELSARDLPLFSFLHYNLSKYQWIFIKLDMCIEIVDIWFRNVNGQILSIFDRVICPRHIRTFVSGRSLY